MVFGLVSLSVPKGVLTAQPQAEIREPTVVLNGLADPNRTRVVGMSFLIGKCMEIIWIQDPVCTVQELSRFKYHFNDMLVAMRLGGFARIW
jgi:hypothetical protein